MSHGWVRGEGGGRGEGETWDRGHGVVIILPRLAQIELDACETRLGLRGRGGGGGGEGEGHNMGKRIHGAVWVMGTMPECIADRPGGQPED